MSVFWKDIQCAPSDPDAIFICRGFLSQKAFDAGHDNGSPPCVFEAKRSFFGAHYMGRNNGGAWTVQVWPLEWINMPQEQRKVKSYPVQI